MRDSFTLVQGKSVGTILKQEMARAIFRTAEEPKYLPTASAMTFRELRLRLKMSPHCAATALGIMKRDVDDLEAGCRVLESNEEWDRAYQVLCDTVKS